MISIMNKPSVSIIVPVYNVAPYVEDSIRSVMRQTYDGKMECIVVDDCGTEDSMSIVEKVIEDYNGPITFKILHHTHNRGLSAARNTGMDAATGDYLSFLDSDDELTDDCIERLVEPLNKEWYDMVVGDASGYEKDETDHWRKTDFWELNISDNTLLRGTSILSTFGKKWKWSAWSKLYRSDFVNSNCIRFKEGLLFEDMLWGFMIASLASSVYLLNHSIYLYKCRMGSITHPINKKIKIESLRVIVQEMGDFIVNNQINKVLSFPILNRFFSEVVDYYSNFLSCYVEVYKQLRIHVRINMKELMQVNQYHLRSYLHDLHYLLPVLIAPYWQYGIYHCLRPLILNFKKIW